LGLFLLQEESPEALAPDFPLEGLLEFPSEEPLGLPLEAPGLPLEGLLELPSEEPPDLDLEEPEELPSENLGLSLEGLLELPSEEPPDLDLEEPEELPSENLGLSLENPDLFEPLKFLVGLFLPPPLDLGGAVLKVCVGSNPSIIFLGIADFKSFSISTKSLCSSALTKETALPSCPALAVLPMR